MPRSSGVSIDTKMNGEGMTIRDRVREHGDVWAEALRVKQRLEPALAPATET